MSWQTRTLAQFIAATVPVEKAGDTSELLEQASLIAFDKTEAAELKRLANAPPDIKPKEPRIGSYERLMSGLGGNASG